jgi:hypothetical protein
MTTAPAEFRRSFGIFRVHRITQRPRGREKSPMTESGSNQKRNGCSLSTAIISRRFIRLSADWKAFSDQRRIPASYSARLASFYQEKIQRKDLDFSPPPPPPSCLPAYKSLLHYFVSKGSRRIGKRENSVHLLFILRGCAHTCVWSGIHQRAQLDQRIR